ncbi:hypothetical protein ACFL1M_01655 [Patescibacteria group bacterium]
MSQNKNSNIQEQVKKFQIITAMLTIISITALVFGIFFSNKILKNITTTRQQISAQEAQIQASIDQADFFKNNQEMIETIEKSLPNQDNIVDMVREVEALQEEIGFKPLFNFSAIVPTKEGNEIFVPFNMKVTTNALKMIDFLRRFEKICLVY